MIEDPPIETQPPLGHVVESGPVNPTSSVLKQLRDSAKKARENKTIDLPIPDFAGLYVTFRALSDYSEVRSALVKVLKKKGLSAADRDVEVSVETLLMSSVSSYALVDDVRHEIPGRPPLGRALYDELFPPERDDEIRPENDQQAVLWLFGQNTVQITTLAAQLDLWFKNTNLKLDEDLLGE